MEGSDLFSYLESSVLELTSSEAKPSTEASMAEYKNTDAEPLVAAHTFDKTVPIYLQEFSKSIAMVSNNGGDLASAH